MLAQVRDPEQRIADPRTPARSPPPRCTGRSRSSRAPGRTWRPGSNGRIRACGAPVDEEEVVVGAEREDREQAQRDPPRPDPVLRAPGSREQAPHTSTPSAAPARQARNTIRFRSSVFDATSAPAAAAAVWLGSARDAAAPWAYARTPIASSDSSASAAAILGAQRPIMPRGLARRALGRSSRC